MTRTGKIARLPREIRQKLNEGLRAGETAKNLVDWLNDFPVVQTIVACEFEGVPIREQNISEWRKGGYQDWLQQENALEVAVRLGETAKRWQESGQVSMTEMLAFWLMSQFAVATQEIAQAEGEKRWGLLNKMSANLVKLHRIEKEARKWRLAQVSSTLSSSGHGGSPTQQARQFPYATSAEVRAREEALARAEREWRQPRDNGPAARDAECSPTQQPKLIPSAASKAQAESAAADGESGGHGAYRSYEPFTEAQLAAEEARIEAWNRAQQQMKQDSAERKARFGFPPENDAEPIT